MSSASCHDLLMGKLERRAPLSAADRQAILALPCQIRSIEPAGYLVREGDPPEFCSLVVDGFAFRQKLTSHGARQILSFHVPGDLLDLPSLFLKVADHSIQTLVRSEIAFIPIAALQQLALDRPAIGRAMWVDALIDGSIFREWILNVGRRDARGRVAHLLCEIVARMRAADLIDSDDGFELPMTQEQLADATGLTPVHVNRTLQALKADGLIGRAGRTISIPNWASLRAAADFNRRYLHLDQTPPAEFLKRRSGPRAR